MATERVYICRLADLPPGRLRYAEVDGLPIGLAHVGGAIYAFGDSCRHEGGPLSAGVLVDHTVTCPWHGWAYDVRSGKSVVPPVGLRVPVYPVEVADGAVYILVDWGEA